MPKIKSHKGAAKRFSFTGTGKIKRSKQNKRHLLNHKNSKRRARLGKTAYADKTNELAIKKMLPYQ